MVTGGKLQLKGNTLEQRCPTVCSSRSGLYGSQNLEQLWYDSSENSVPLRAGGNPWDVKKKKAKKKQVVRVDEGEEAADVLENGDVRTKGGHSTPCTSHRALSVLIIQGTTTCCQAMHLSSTLCCRWEDHQGCVSLRAIQHDI